MYNNNCFGLSSKVYIRLNDTPGDSNNCAAFRPHNDMPTAKYLFKYLSCDIPSIDKSTALPLTINHSKIIK